MPVRTGKIFLMISIVSMWILTGCGNSYYDMEARELAKNIRDDSLFFGLYLGMPSKEFYTQCWQLNKTGLIHQGSMNTTVYHKIKHFKYPAAMEFYPSFWEDKIFEMPLTFSYDGWAPWNKHLFADSLKLEVLHLMEEWFGKGFLEIKNPDPTGGNAFVKISGNKRISIYNFDDHQVKADIVDLPVLKALEKMKNN